MAFLKTIWKSHKHKKLSDEWDLSSEKEADGWKEGSAASSVDGISFSVKFLGSCPLGPSSNAAATASAVKTIVSQTKQKKAANVQFAINLRGISVIDSESKDSLMDVSLYRISYCSADASYGHVFAFNATDDHEKMHCYAFLCPKRKMAQLMSITVAQTFNTAFHLWKISNNGKSQAGKDDSRPLTSNILKGGEGLNEEKRSSVVHQVLAPVPMLIDLTSPFDENTKPQNKQWASFED